MKTALRIGEGLLDRIHGDLDRSHIFANERVGFIACATSEVRGGMVLLADEYLPVADKDYIDIPTVGAMMGPAAIRNALEYAYGRIGVVMLHVHRHEHRGKPAFSKVDISESSKFVPDFWKVRPGLPHGMVVLSCDAMSGMTWDPATRRPEAMSQISVVGRSLSIFGKWWR